MLRPSGWALTALRYRGRLRRTRQGWAPLFKRIIDALCRKSAADSHTVCSACGDAFVYPVRWQPADDEHWWMLLRCGACGECRQVTLPDSEAHRFDRELVLAELQMEREADRLSQERLETEVQTFASALELDLIDADDFARQPDTR
jgi:hypothetical protein